MKGHITLALLDAIFQGYSMAFNKGLRQTETQWQKVAMLSKSTSSETAYPFLGQTGAFREWVGERVFQQLKLHGYSIKNKTFEQSHSVSRDTIEDDEYGVFGPLFEQLGVDAKLFPDELIFEMIRNAHNLPCYDGQNFFDHEHPVNTKHDLTGDNVPISNIITQSQASDKAWYIADTSKPIMPFMWQNRLDPVLDAVTNNNEGAVWLKNEYEYGTYLRGNAGLGLWQLAARVEGDITWENIKAARARLRGFQGDGAKRLNIRATTIICAGDDFDEFDELLNTEFISGTTNPAYRLRDRLEIVDSDFLDPDIALPTP